ncbi:uncharacterized protein [Argopecten irradians]|uniref:uncharacterized protein isoform X2 n=1 Tax=Argopecten irradians TaxID=31199 RepID=UPI0037192D8D
MSTSSEEEINEKNDQSVTKGKHTSPRLCEDKDGQKENLSITAEVGGTSSKSSTQRDDPRKPATTTVSFFSNPVSYVWDKVRGTKHKDKGIKRSGKPDYYDELGFQNKHSRRPGKPTCSDSGSDYIQLAWKVPDDKNVLYYETKYKQAQKELWNKESVMTRDTSPSIYIRGLLQDTEYEFKVRGHYKDDEGEYSEKSESIRTPKSPALSVRQKCMKLQDGEPSFYKVPLTENKKARNEKFKTRKCEFGSSNLISERTIMMIGATGSGKSTLIDGMLNHLLGVKWEDDFRFKIIDLMSEEEARKGHQIPGDLGHRLCKTGSPSTKKASD